ncbi:MAG: hypothetical protein KAI28_00555 [Sphingomonadales bacterium]|nr:hypothetical protein [Sphingomonadales bacterium]
MNDPTIEQMEDKLRLAATELPPDLRKEFYRRSQKRYKDPDTFAVLNWGLMLGAQHLYLGNWFRALIDIIGWCIGVLIVIQGKFVIGIAILITVILSDLYTLFNSQKIVSLHNIKTNKRIMRDLQPTPYSAEPQ